LLLSNLGCEGVNRWCAADTRKQSLRYAADIENVGKRRPEQNGKYPVNGNDEKVFAAGRTSERRLSGKT
jgi:hypothetical protein